MHLLLPRAFYDSKFKTLTKLTHKQSSLVLLVFGVLLVTFYIKSYNYPLKHCCNYKHRDSLRPGFMGCPSVLQISVTEAEHLGLSKP